MFRISKKADYAVSIMCQLAQREKAFLAGGEPPPLPPVSAHEIAADGGLSKSMTANLMKAMTRGGMLESLRGTNGGYRLSRPASAISLAEILAAVEGPMQLVACVADGSEDPEAHADCSVSLRCPSRNAMRLVHDRIERLFAEISLAELSTVNEDPLAALAIGGNRTTTPTRPE